MNGDLLAMLQECIIAPNNADVRKILADWYEEHDNLPMAAIVQADINRIEREQRELQELRANQGKDKRYNGWTNYETWNVALWLDNDEGSQFHWNDQAQEVCDENTDDGVIDRDAATYDLANRLRQQIDNEDCPDTAVMSGMYSDLLNAALSEVDWYEIARHYIDEVEDPEPEEEDEPEESIDEPSEDDYTTEDHVNFYQSGKLVVTVDDTESWQDAIRRDMEENGFFPTCWFISDHGNAHRMELSVV